MKTFLAIKWVSGETTYYLSRTRSWTHEPHEAMLFEGLGELFRFVQKTSTSHFTYYGVEGDRRYQIVEFAEMPNVVEKRRFI